MTLTDHIHFAIQRYEDHMNFPNPMLREVRLFYEKEFALGEYALGMIKQRLNISLPLDDAASIALHIVSAEFDTRVKDTLKDVYKRQPLHQSAVTNILRRQNVHLTAEWIRAS